MELPQELKQAIDEELTGGAGVRDAAAGLSSRYRAGKPGGAGYIADETDAAAYAAARMPATYAAVRAALTEAAACMPGLRPNSLVDAGAGPGTAAWAAAAIWPELNEITLLERDGSMAALGRRLAAQSPSPALRSGRWVMADLTGEPVLPRCDIAVLSYALGELPEEKQALVVRRLWEKAETLVLVEPGTVAGFTRIWTMREMLREAGATIAAPCPCGTPCPGGTPCPEKGGWCHFSARVARSRLHRQAKGAALAYEDEKFSYLAATKLECSPCAARVLRHPMIYKGHVKLDLCTPEGREQVTVSKRMGEDYRTARDLQWGDAAPPALGQSDDNK